MSEKTAKKTVIITGGSRGIGKAAALRFAKEGYNITINCQSSEPKGLLNEIENLGGKAILIKADISQFSEAERVVKETLKTFGSIDVLVNNAGITKDKLIIRMTEDDFDSVIDVNLKGAFNMIRHVSSIMIKKRSGTIINMSSISGLGGNAGQANYSSSKAGLIGLTKTIATELGGRGITCNAVAPGVIDTDMPKKLSQEILDEMIKKIPAGRFGLAEEVADTVYFLTTNKYITGQVICIDGGMMLL